MIAAAHRAPGLGFAVKPPAAEPSPLRSDVAGFLGRTRRGPLGEWVRVEGWRAYLRVFGGLTAEADTPYAIRGYFENGGQVAYVRRLAGPLSKGTASAELPLGRLDSGTLAFTADSPVPAFFQAASYRIEAATPGA